MLHSPVRLALFHPKRVLLLAAALAMLAGFALALQSVSADSHDQIKLTIGERNEDGTFTLTIENATYSDFSGIRNKEGDGGIPWDGGDGPLFSWTGHAPVWGFYATRDDVLRSELGVPYDAEDDDHPDRAVPSLRFTATYPQDGDAAEADRSITFSLVMYGFDAGVPDFDDGDGVARSNMVTLTPPPTPAASVTGALRQDADGRLAPRDSTQLTIGLQIAPNFDDYPNLAANTQTCVAIGSTDDDGNTDTAPTGACGANNDAADAGGAELDGESYLVISGPAAFSNGSKRISVVDLKCESSKAISSSAPEGNGTCYARWDADGDADTAPVVPTISVDSDADSKITVTANLVAKQDSTVDGEEIFYAVLDNKEGTEIGGARGLERESTQKRAWHDVTGSYYKLAKSYFGQYEINIDTVQQLSSIALSRKLGSNNLPESGAVRIGQKADFNLALRNANNQPSQVSAVSAITVTVVGGGTLSSDYCPAGNISSCTVNLATEAPEEAGRKSARVDAGTNPALLGGIPFTFTAPRSPGTSTIRATVIGASAGNFQETLAFTVSGSATAITLGDGVPSILAYGTPDPVADDPDTADEDESDPGDSRDTVSISISATDANGNPARIPADESVTVTGPGDAALPSGSHSAQVNCADAERTRCSVVIDVNAPAASPLPSGLYTATVSGGGVKEIKTTFNVAGNPAAVAISLPDALGAVGESFTATVNVTDAAGIPVADGEMVEFSSAATAGGVLTARVVSPAPNAEGERKAATKNGQVTAQVTITGRGVAVLTATARGDKAKSAVINTESAAIPTTDAGPVIRYLTPDGQPGTGPADYLGTTETTAVAILAMNEAASAVWLFNGRRWIRYAEDAAGEAVPGSIPFSVLPNDILWFGG